MNPTTAQTAQKFAAQWLDAWNGHDIEAILSHYADEIVFLSPLAQQRVGNGQVIESRRCETTGALALRNNRNFDLNLRGF